MKGAVRLILLMWLCASCAAAGDVHEARKHITAADAAYRRGVEAASDEEAASAFAEAEREYAAAIEAGAANGFVYYNRGNARLKCGRLGGAIADYERALRLLPRFSDLRANLRYAEDKAAGNALGSAPHDLLEPVLAWHTRTRLSETAWAAVGLYAGVFLLLGLHAFRPSPGLRRAAVITAVLCAFACGSLALKLWDRAQVQAVVLADDTPVRAGNAESFTEKYRVAEGSRVRVLQQRGDWYKVRISRDKVGWVRKSAVEVI